jgi:sporulation protein YtfJ
MERDDGTERAAGPHASNGSPGSNGTGRPGADPTPMAAHPIEGLMKTAMESIKGMIDVNTVVGRPVSTDDGTTIIPISRVSLGFAAGGGEFWRPDGHDGATRPFGGGSGAGVSVKPMGFLVQRGDAVRMLPVEGGDLWDHLLEVGPQVVQYVQDWVRGKDSHQATYSYTSSEPKPSAP